MRRRAIDRFAAGGGGRDFRVCDIDEQAQDGCVRVTAANFFVSTSQASITTGFPGFVTIYSNRPVLTVAGIS